jgi:hypothetical protein
LYPLITKDVEAIEEIDNTSFWHAQGLAFPDDVLVSRLLEEFDE